MPLRLDTATPGFEERFSDLLAMKREVSEDVDAVVRDIIGGVRSRGDAALFEYSQRFDRVDLRKLGLAIAADDIARAEAECARDVLDALDLAHARIRAFHERQRPQDQRFVDHLGVELGWRWTALEAVRHDVPVVATQLATLNTCAHASG